MLYNSLAWLVRSRGKLPLTALVLLPLVVLAIPVLGSGWKSLRSSENEPALDFALLVEPSVRASEPVQANVTTKDEAENLLNWQYTKLTSGS